MISELKVLNQATSSALNSYQLNFPELCAPSPEPSPFSPTDQLNCSMITYYIKTLGTNNPTYTFSTTPNFEPQDGIIPTLDVNSVYNFIYEIEPVGSHPPC